MRMITSLTICSLLIFILACDGGIDYQARASPQKQMYISICDTIPKNEMECNMKAVKNFEHYFFTDNGQLFGVDDQFLKRIEPIDQDGDLLWVVGFNKSKEKGEDVLYFTTIETDSTDTKAQVQVEKHYKQLCGEMTEERTGTVYQTPARSKLSGVNFSIKDFDYQGTACSDVRNLPMKSGIERFFMVDGFFENDLGLFFNVSDGRYNETTMVRQPGLYFWDIKSKGITRMTEKGELF